MTGRDPIDAILDLAIDEDLATGFRLAAEHTFLPHQYFLVFKEK